MRTGVLLEENEVEQEGKKLQSRWKENNIHETKYATLMVNYCEIWLKFAVVFGFLSIKIDSKKMFSFFLFSHERMKRVNREKRKKRERDKGENNQKNVHVVAIWGRLDWNTDKDESERGTD